MVHNLQGWSFKSMGSGTKWKVVFLSKRKVTSEVEKQRLGLRT